MSDKGSVFLVGAGPGDPDYLTVKALRLIEVADAVVYDRLVSPEILQLVPAGTARIDVGKRPGAHPVPQDEINEILIKLARAGHMVVRLKGGDPMIFGRGGEEARALIQAGIPVTTVPGVTAAQGCAASLNMALTERGIANSVIYLTGHDRNDQIPDLGRLAENGAKTTIVIYMGAGHIARIAQKLKDAGLDQSTPALAISKGTTPAQQQHLTTLDRLAGDMDELDLPGPVLFIVGDAARSAADSGAIRNAELEHQIYASDL